MSSRDWPREERPGKKHSPVTPWSTKNVFQNHLSWVVALTITRRSASRLWHQHTVQALGYNGLVESRVKKLALILPASYSEFSVKAYN